MRIQRKARSRQRRRRYPANRIKQWCCYEPAEIAKLFGVHRNTVRHWLKNGLLPIDGRRPVLVHGSELKTFLARRQAGRRQKCAPGQLYCFRCRAPRTPWENLVDVAPHTEKVAKLTAICCVCETRMHRTIRRADLPKFAAAIERPSMASERLMDRPIANANCDFEKDNWDAEDRAHNMTVREKNVHCVVPGRNIVSVQRPERMNSANLINNVPVQRKELSYPRFPPCQAF